MTSTPDITSTIYCDTDGCSEKLVVAGAIDEMQAVDVALDHGWRVTIGTMRVFHRCAKHGGEM